MTERLPSRRRFLVGGTAVLFAAACGSSGDGTGPAEGTAATPGPVDVGSATPEPTSLTVADFEGLGACVPTPEAAAGPFPLDEQFVRRDITEGYDGRPLRLGARVLDAGCAAIPGAAVEVWHTDATGDYSAFADGGGGKDEAEGTTFLRGTQTADDDGIVEFLTIVPGWYPGRAVHIHLRAHVADETVRTTQLYFGPDFVTDVYDAAPYAEFGEPDTSNAADALAGDPARDGTLLATSESETDKGPGSLGLVNLSIEGHRG